MIESCKSKTYPVQIDLSTAANVREFSFTEPLKVNYFLKEIRKILNYHNKDIIRYHYQLLCLNN